MVLRIAIKSTRPTAGQAAFAGLVQPAFSWPFSADLGKGKAKIGSERLGKGRKGKKRLNVFAVEWWSRWWDGEGYGLVCVLNDYTQCSYAVWDKPTSGGLGGSSLDSRFRNRQ